MKYELARFNCINKETHAHHSPSFMNFIAFSAISVVVSLAASRYCSTKMFGAKLTMFCSPHPYGILTSEPRF